MSGIFAPGSSGTAILGALGILGTAGALAALLLGAPAAARSEAPEALDAQRTRAELDVLFGRPPASCVAVGAGLSLCQWWLGDRDPAWASLARSIDTSARVNVLCVVPDDGGARAPGSCTVHPRRSQRQGWEVPNLHPPRRGDPPLEDRRAARERLALRAEAELAQAETLLELSRLVGAAPDQCLSPQPAIRSCVWHATSRTEGHGMLAARIAAPKRKKVRLECRLPADGAPRSAESCRVEIGP